MAPAMAIVPFARGLVSALWRERFASAAEMRAIRDRRLAKLVRHARESTALWSERLAHVDPRLPINLAQIAPITKSELLERFEPSIAGGALSLDEVRAFARDPERIGRPYKGRYMIATTSGTTGRIGYFVQDLGAFAEMNGALFARVLRHRLNPSEIIRFCFGRRYRMAMAIAVEGHFITRLVAGFRPILTRALVDLRAFSIASSAERLVHELNRFRPHYLHGYATVLEGLAHERMEGRLAIDPEFISLGSEPVSMSARQAIVRAFPRAQLSETYGATECLAIANQCSAGRLHVNEDLAIVEPVDAAGRPVPVGVASDKLYLTNLVNRAQPLLRYEVSDAITLLGDDCPCGSPMMSIRVEGRADDTFFLEDASGRYQAHPPVPLEALFLGVEGLRQYQLIHERQNALRILYVSGPEVGDRAHVGLRLQDAFRRYLERRGLSGCVQLAVEPVDAIPRQPGSHKLRQIYSKVPRPDALAV
jgi:phenylacetate-coenzyme A ligase PaaK-like adenylate-forming protein